MSVSKLESLPNEILIDLFLNHMNPVDVFVGFGHDLNNRFTALVNRCKLFYIDLTNISKKDFDHYLNSLILYSNDIKGLSLSESLPGQMNIFLSIFPTFDQFKNLYELNIYFDGTNFEINLLLSLLKSLSKTLINTLTMKLVNGKHSFDLMDNCSEYLCLKTLRRVVLDINDRSHQWNFNKLNQCFIKYLTISGGGCTLNHFKTILSICQNLLYLNIRVTADTSNKNIDKNIPIESLKNLRELVVHCYESEDQIEIDCLIPYLRNMSNLRQLEIITLKRDYINGFIWEIFLEESLLFLKEFRLIIYNYFVPDCFTDEILIKSFSTPFWINKKYLNIFRGIAQWNNYQKFILFYYPIERKSFENRSFKISSNETNLLSLSLINNLIISQHSPIPSFTGKLNFIKYFHIDYLDQSVFQWVLNFVNLNQIIQLNCLNIEKKFHLIRLLLLEMNHLNDLTIKFKQLIQLNNQIKSLRKLNISFEKHLFDEKHILFLSNLFPYLEHIQINPVNLQNLHLLPKYFPNLITLTFPINNLQLNENNDKRDQFQLNYNYRNKFVTIWIDQNTFNNHVFHSNLISRFLNKIKSITMKSNYS